MPREIWLLRHAEAVPHGATPDAERDLTPRGEHQAKLAGRGLARLALRFDACYTSPKVRAHATAALACEPLGLDFEMTSALAGGFDREDALDLFHEHDGDARLLVVGHDPDLSQLVHDLTGARVGLDKGGVAGIALDGAGELLVLLRALELETLAGSGL